MGGSMSPQKIYLDDNGNPIQSAKVYLDDNGNPMGQPTQPQQPTKANLPDLGQATGIRAPEGLLEKARSFYLGNIPIPIQDAISGLIKQGSAIGLNDPAVVLGGPGKTIAGAIEQRAIPVASIADEMMNVPRPTLLQRVKQYNQNLEEAKNTVKTGPEVKRGINQNLSVDRAAQINKQVEPLLQGKEELVKTRSVTSAVNAENRAKVGLNRQRDLETLKASTEQATKNARAQINSKVDAIKDQIGPVVRQTEIAQGVQAAEGAKYRSYTDGAGNLYKKNSEIAQANVFPIEKVTPKVGVLEGGQQAYNKTTTNIIGPISHSSLKSDPELKRIYDIYGDAITAASRQGSPSAGIIKEIMEGPNVVDYDVARKNLEALNNIGYGKADYELRKAAPALARMIGGKYRESLKESVSTWKVGGEEAASNLEAAAKLLKERTTKIVTGSVLSKGKSAQQALSRVGSKGNPIALLNDPIAFDGVWGAVADTPVANGIRANITNHILSAKDLPTKWSSVAPEIKEALYTPSQITNLDDLATNGPKALNRIIEESNIAKQQIITNARKEYAALAAEKRGLSSLTQKRTDLAQKVRSERVAIKAQLDKDRLRKMNELDKDITRAKEFIEKNKTLKNRMKLVATGATLLGLGWAGGKATHITNLISGGQ
jgi:hypothetical protein